jgi:hypothetical protein
MQRIAPISTPRHLLPAGAATLVAGATLTIVDGANQSDCAKSMTWVGYLGWALVGIGAAASVAGLTSELADGRRRALVPGGVAFLALCICVGLAVVRASLRTLCGIEFDF